MSVNITKNKKKTRESMSSKFRSAISKEISKIMVGVTEAEFAIAEHNLNRLFDLSQDEPAQASSQLKSNEELVNRLILGFLEIEESVKKLHNIAIYIHRFPYVSTRIVKSTYLKYHMENYLNEIYLLQERMKTYLKVISHFFKKDPQGMSIDQITRSISKKVVKVMSGLVKARNMHVHHRRYTDRDFDRLNILELLKDETIPNINIARLYQLTYLTVLIAKRNFVKRTNKVIDSLLEEYFKYLWEILLDAGGNLKIPRNLTLKNFQTDSTSRYHK